jgi:hypothetical protein
MGGDVELKLYNSHVALAGAASGGTSYRQLALNEQKMHRVVIYSSMITVVKILMLRVVIYSSMITVVKILMLPSFQEGNQVS